MNATKGVWACALMMGSIAMAQSWAGDAGALVPLKDFARQAQYTSVGISPDGTYLAIKVPEEDRSSLAFMHIQNRKIEKITGMLRPGSGEHVYQFWWKGNNRILATLARQDGYIAQPVSTGELVAMDADGKAYRYLFGYNGSIQAGTHLTTGTRHYGYLEMIDPLVDDPKKALVSVRSWRDVADGNTTAENIDVYSGALDAIAATPFPGGSGIDFLADQQGQLRYVSGRGKDFKLQTYRRDLDSTQWVALDSEAFGGNFVWPLHLSADEKSVYLSQQSMVRPDCLVAQKIETGEVKDVLCDSVADLEEPLMSFDGKDVIGGVFEPGLPKFAYAQAGRPEQRFLQSLARAFPGQFVLPVSHSQDGKQIVVSVYSDRNPGDYYLVDRDTHEATYLLSAREWIDPDQMSEVRPVEFAGRDGTVLHGYLTLPRGRATKHLPMIVNPHGGPFGIRDHWQWNADAQMLASRGYAVLNVNFRGSGGYGEKFFEQGKQRWGTQMIDDISDATHWAVKAGYADPARLCIYGGSYGGYAAMMSAVREPNLYRCVVAYAGVYDLNLWKHDTDVSDSTIGRTYIEKYVGATEEERRQQSPLTYIDKLQAPVLIAHGEDDTRVPFSQAKALAAALDKRHASYEAVFKDGEGHGFYKEKNRLELYEKMLDFIKRNIGDGAEFQKPAPAAPGP